jgi:hypothetical protein
VLRGQADAAGVALRHTSVKAADGTASTEAGPIAKTIGDGTGGGGARIQQNLGDCPVRVATTPPPHALSNVIAMVPWR